MFSAHRFRLRPFAFLLSGLLVSLMIGLCPMTSVAQDDGAFDADNPIASLQEANPTSDQERVELATQLMHARSDTKISRSEYRKGVHYFRENHPTFYGNFFGDPVYASYDVTYDQLARKAQEAYVDVNPRTSVLNPQGFFCAPQTYDPAFGGVCFGFAWAKSDYFRLPSSFHTPRMNAEMPSMEEVAEPTALRLADRETDRNPENATGCYTSQSREGSSLSERCRVTTEGRTDPGRTDPGRSASHDNREHTRDELDSDGVTPAGLDRIQDGESPLNVDDIVSNTGRNLEPVRTSRRDDFRDDSRRARDLSPAEVRRRLDRATRSPSHDLGRRSVDLDQSDRAIRTNRRGVDSSGDIDRPQRTSRGNFDRAGSPRGNRVDRSTRSNRSSSGSGGRSEPKIRRRGELDPNG